MALHISEILLSKKRLLAWLESFCTDEATSFESLKKLRRVLKQEKEMFLKKNTNSTVIKLIQIESIFLKKNI